MQQYHQVSPPPNAKVKGYMMPIRNGAQTGTRKAQGLKKLNGSNARLDSSTEEYAPGTQDAGASGEFLELNSWRSAENPTPLIEPQPATRQEAIKTRDSVKRTATRN